ncbi:right-handed parallel beta-helix repeat-containing protein [Alkalihalobacillus sp. CinArs1]|uniref:right-handed parallel beta-helix repeat-containing protein n=1 Tax=Alkalihalobacillus sp. CinArs1 TaxID=2995314 RepID=UPI0022DDD1F5|nr:right-handed parallel beta-helix repeat-containing protein [Alkalihalobacillus sp. CinArs1]
MEACSQRLLQEQINRTSASGGGTVFIEECTYILTEPLILKAGVHLQGAGQGKSILKINPKDANGISASHKLLIADRSDNIKISNVTFDGVKYSREDLIDDPYAHTVEVAWCNHFELDQVEIINSASASIVLYNSTNGTIKDCSIKNSGSNGILALQDCRSISVLNNTIENTDFQNGIFFSYQLGKSSSTITIEGNTIKNAADFGIEVGHTVAEGDPAHSEIVVRNNTVVNSQNSGIAFRTVSFGLIEDNVIEGYGKNGGYGGDGIFVEGFRNRAEKVNVMNNTVKQTNTTGNANAIYITGVDQVNVVGNQMVDSNGKGVFAQASVMGVTTNDFPNGRRRYNNITVLENEISNPKGVGIQFQGEASQENRIIGNIVTNSGEEGILIANLDDENRGIMIERNTITSSSFEGIGIFRQQDFSLNENKLVNNGQAVDGVENRQAGVRLTAVGNGALIENTFKDDQDTPTQLYYIVVRQTNGRVTNDGVRLIGGTKSKLVINSPNYTESDITYQPKDSAEFEEKLFDAVVGLENLDSETIDEVLSIVKNIVQFAIRSN